MFVRTVFLVLIAALPAVANLHAADNAALSKYGATIQITCNAPTPLNDRWSKPIDMLKEEKPSGPIINDLSAATIRISFPLRQHVTGVAVIQGDYKGSFAKPKDFSVTAPETAAKSFSLANDPGKAQAFDYAAETDTIEFRFSSVHPPAEDAARKYGTITQVQVFVSENMADVFSPPKDVVRDLPVYTMRTPNLDPQKAPKVIGTPRKAEGHPCTIWDKQDIAAIKEQIQKQPAAKRALDGIVAYCEKACAKPIEVPDKPDDGVDVALAARHTQVASSIANLGIGYALTGDERFAREAKRLLLDLAKYYEGWPIHGHPKFKHDSSKWSWQRLGDAIWLIPAAWGFDLIHDSPSLADAERATIRDGFVMPCVKNIMRSEGIIHAPTNWSAVCCAAVMIGARVSGDQIYYEKTWKAVANKKGEEKKGGIYLHLDKGIDDDGMWAEGAIGYQFMAMRGLLVMAEILWHDGIDVYSYRDGRLKLVFDSPLWFCYPGGTDSPAIHDSGGASLFNRDSHLYQYAQRRYGDKTYNAILGRITPTLESVYNLFLPACEFAPVEAADLPRVPSILFPGVGFATARCGDGSDSKYLMMDYGPNRSHGHPDKLNHCFFALGQELFADGGSAWYSTDLYLRYYSHSLAHNTVSANGSNQIMTGGKLDAYSSSGPYALMRASCDSAIPCTSLDRTLVLSGNRLYDVYAVVSGVPFSFDLPYHSHGRLEQQVATEAWKEHPKEAAGFAYYKEPVTAAVDGDWRCAWKVERGRLEMHGLGEKGTQLIFATTPKGGDDLGTVLLRRKTARTAFATVSDVVPNGAEPSVKQVRRVTLPDQEAFLLDCETTDGAREAVLVNYTGGEVALEGWTTDARVAFVRVEKGALTAFILAGGKTLKGDRQGTRNGIDRQDAKDAKRQETGGRIEDGGRDPQAPPRSPLLVPRSSSDRQDAKDAKRQGAGERIEDGGRGPGAPPRSPLLAPRSSADAKNGGISVMASVPSLLTFRTLKDGLGQLCNQGGTATRVELSGVGTYESFAATGADGARGAATTANVGSFAIDATAYGTFELTRGTQPTVAQYEADERASKIRAALEAEAAAKKKLEQARDAQYAQAKEAGPAAGTFVLVQAESFAAQGGGEVTISDKKAATFGTCFLNWDRRGHWIDYNVEIPKDGYYKILLKYCREGGSVIRALRVDGEYPSESARKFELPGTGGWSNGADNWQYYTLSWPGLEEAFLVKLTAGKHTLRLENSGGDGVNLDYIVFASHPTEVTRALVEK